MIAQLFRVFRPTPTHLASCLAFGLLLGVLPAGPTQAQEKKKPKTSKEAQRKNPAAPGSIAPDEIGAPRIVSFELEDSRGKPVITSPGPLYLAWKVKGSKLIQYHYRVSLSPAFPDASWHSAPKGRPTYSFPEGEPPGVKTVHLQLMTEDGQQSEVVKDRVKYAPRRPDLTPTVSHEPNPVYPGQVLTYTVTVRNDGDGGHDDFFLLLTQLADGLEFVAIDEASPPLDPGRNPCFTDQDQVNCRIPELHPGREAWIRFRARFPTSAEPGSSLTSTVLVDPQGYVDEEDKTNNEIQAVTGTTEAPLAEHVIDGKVAVEFAKQQGFGFPGENLSEVNPSICKNAGASFELQLPGPLLEQAVLPEIEENALRCRLGFFAYEKLNAPWKLTAVEYEIRPPIDPTAGANESAWAIEPKYGTDDPFFALVVSNGAGSSLVLGRIKSITLTAPQNHGDWQDAFRP